MPFVTAEIWQALPVAHNAQAADLACEPYPPLRTDCIFEKEAQRMEFIQEVIVAVRTIKAELNIAPSHKANLLLLPVDEAQACLLEDNRNILMTLARLEALTVATDAVAPKASASSVVRGCQVIMPLRGAVDLSGELQRLDKELAKLEKEIISANKKLMNESYASRAPAEVVAREKDRAAKLLETLATLQTLKNRFAEALAEEQQMK
jgi:valyl-tRNA synthetase